MNKKLLILTACLCVLMLCICAFAACNNEGNDNETGTDTGVNGSETAEPASGDGADTDGTVTSSINEDVTAIPRYDYFEADVSKDVTIDKSVYTDMKLTLPSDLLITDEVVQDYIKGLVFERRIAVNGTTQVTDQPLKLGDSAFIYYRGVIDGKDLDRGSNMEDAEPFELPLGSDSFIPGFEEGLIGVVPNQTSREKPFELNLTFPENYGSAEIAGKAVTFYVVVEYAIQYTLPEYNRDFVENTLLYEPQKEFYAGDKALLQEFEAYVKEYLESQNLQNVEYAKTDALWVYLTGTCECRNLPEDEISFYYDSYVSEIEYYYNMYTSYYGEEFAAAYPDEGTFAVDYMGLDAGTDWTESLKKMATQMVQKDMITHAIGEIEGIESVTDEEVQTEIDYWVDYYQGYMTEEEIIQSMGMLYLRESAYAVKMSDWLMNRATFTYGE